MLAALAAWVLIPIAVLLVRAAQHGGFTGVTGIDPYDQYQYLSWIRDSGLHGLASNLFDMTGGAHVFLQPMWLLSGLLWRAGLSLQAAYLLWAPICVIVLWIGYWKYAQRMGEGAGRRVTILVLGLFLTTPLGWLHLPITHWTAELQLASSDDSTALQPWFAFPTAIALGLMPLALLGWERLLDENQAPPYNRLTIVGTSAACAAISWIHSWQGATVLLVMVAVLVVRKPHRVHAALALPLAAALSPLIYQYLLTRLDPAWEIARHVNDRPDLVVFTPQLAVLGPLAAAALFAVLRRLPHDRGEWMLLLWPLAAAAVYVLDPEFPPHALQGVALPLSALAVRGWPRRRLRPAYGAAAIALLTVPGLAYYAHALPAATRGTGTLFFQTSPQRAALAYLARHPRGGVLAPPLPLALEVPPFSGHPVWDGHQVWTTDVSRSPRAAAFYAGLMRPPQARAFVTSTGVRWVLFDCPVNRAALSSLLPLVTHVQRVGCAAVAALSPEGR